MATAKQIREEIEEFKILDDVVEVEFDEFILHVDKSDMTGMDINKETIAQVIAEKYQED